MSAAQLVVVGGAAGHRVPVAVLVDERRRQPERAGRERVGEHRGEPVALVGRGGAVPRLVAHHVDAQVRVADERGDVHRGAVRPQRVAPLGVRLPRPRDPGRERVDGDVLDEPEHVAGARRGRRRAPGVSESEQLPVTTVVTPCCGIGSTSGSHHTDGS